MEKRTFENLTIKEGKELIFPCDVEVRGNLTINGGILIVAGELYLSNEDSVFTIRGGDVSVGSLDTLGCNIQINDSDLYVNGTLNCNSISSDSDILVGGDSYANHISCLNYIVEGHNHCGNITAIQDIYIGGDNKSFELTCRDLYVGGNVDVNYHDITIRGSLYVADGISHCNQIAVG